MTGKLTGTDNYYFEFFIYCKNIIRLIYVISLNNTALYTYVNVFVYVCVCKIKTYPLETDFIFQVDFFYNHKTECRTPTSEEPLKKQQRRTVRIN